MLLFLIIVGSGLLGFGLLILFSLFLLNRAINRDFDKDSISPFQKDCPHPHWETFFWKNDLEICKRCGLIRKKQQRK